MIVALISFLLRASSPIDPISLWRGPEKPEGWGMPERMEGGVAFASSNCAFPFPFLFYFESYMFPPIAGGSFIFKYFSPFYFCFVLVHMFCFCDHSPTQSLTNSSSHQNDLFTYTSSLPLYYFHTQAHFFLTHITPSISHLPFLTSTKMPLSIRRVIRSMKNR